MEVPTGATEPRREDEERGQSSETAQDEATPGVHDGFAGVARPGFARQMRVAIQRFLGFGLMRASSRLRTVVSNGESIYARARLESVKIEERYSYEQEISQNPHSRLQGEPDGFIKFVLPYDGHRYFTRQAHADVMRANDLMADPPTDAIIGFLALTGCEHTKLDALLGSRTPYASVPIRAPLRRGDEPFLPGLLIDDSRTWTFQRQYRPADNLLEVQPAEVDLVLDDPDTAEFSPPQKPEDFDGRRVRIMRHVGFEPGLRLRMTVRLEIPRTMADNTHADVSNVFVRWPSHTSLGSLTLTVDGEERLLRYNPKRQGLEWSDVPMIKGPPPASGEIWTFASPEMCLSIPEPGDLYQAEKVTGQAEVKLDRLLSGMEARLYDATGNFRGHPQPELESHISVDFSLILDDAFARRRRSLFQQLHFDEVIPTEMRIDDIKTALRGLGLTVHDPWKDTGPADRWLVAQRAESPDALVMAVYVAGQYHKAERERRVPGGVTYKTELDSGELWVYVYGALPADSRPVIQQMNALRRTLHEQFVRLPARR